MFLLVRCLLKLGVFMINGSPCLSQGISSIFVSLNSVPNCRFTKFSSVVLPESLVSNIVSLICHFCTYTLIPGISWWILILISWSRLYILPQSPSHLYTSYLLLYQRSLRTLPHSSQKRASRVPINTNDDCVNPDTSLANQ